MNFETLEKFDWYNEPEDVRFEPNAMNIFAKKGTDFFQNGGKGNNKDNGHFFFCHERENFDFSLKWNFDRIDCSSQCGIMLRADEKNWFKATVTENNLGQKVLSSYLTLDGYTDWCVFETDDVEEIWFKICRYENDYGAYFSLNGTDYYKFRTFHLKSYDDEIKVGAYITNPNLENYSARLSDLEMNVVF